MMSLFGLTCLVALSTDMAPAGWPPGFSGPAFAVVHHGDSTVNLGWSAVERRAPLRCRIATCIRDAPLRRRVRPLMKARGDGRKRKRTMHKHSWLGLGALLALAVAGCGGGENLEPIPQGPAGRTAQGSVFGDDGATVSNIVSGGAFGLGNDEEQGDGIPVNKFLWQAALDTLTFLPLASTDPFTGVIATDWGAAPNRPDERFKVTAYMLSPALAASSLRVAVYREVRSPEGLWIPAAVDPDTPRKLEDAILTRARQIRIADLEGTTSS